MSQFGASYKSGQSRQKRYGSKDRAANLAFWLGCFMTDDLSVEDAIALGEMMAVVDAKLNAFLKEPVIDVPADLPIEEEEVEETEPTDSI